MAITPTNHARVLGIDPCIRGFGFAVLEQTRLIDWGVARLFSKNDEEFLVRVEALVRRYHPTMIAVEDVAGARRGLRLTRRLNQATNSFVSLGIDSVAISRNRIREVLMLPERATKYHIASTISELFPELEALLPLPRKAWQTENDRMNVFDAVGLAVASAAAETN